MLNELYQLSNLLGRQGLLPHASTHRDVHKMAKCECLCVYLDRDGKPSINDLFGKEETSRLWLHSHGNHDRFPAIKVQKPLLPEHISASFDEAAWKKADCEKKRQMLLELDYTVSNPKSDDIRVKPWTLEQMRPVLEDRDDICLESVRRLLNRFPQKENVSEFYDDFRRAIYDNLWREERFIDFFKKLLVGTFDSKKRQYTSLCACYFDIEDDELDYKVADPDTGNALVQLLLKAQGNPEEAGETSGKMMGISALSGTRMALVRDKYPNPAFQVIGPSYLYSNNTGAYPCLTRYNLERTGAFPAGEAQVSRMNDALGFLMKEERRGKTWTSFWGTSSKTPLLLLAWLESDPSGEMDLADVFANNGGSSIYEDMCEKVLKMLRGKLSANRKDPVHLQLFETLDKGRKQIVYSRTMTVEQVYENVAGWMEAAENIPSVKFNVKWKNKDGKPVHFVRPWCPGPGAISSVLRTQYRTQNSGNIGRMQDRRSCPITEEEVYRLFLPDTYGGRRDAKLIETCMKETLRTCGELLLDAFRFQRVASKGHPFTKEMLWRACAALELLGILLYKKGIRKEDYMKSKMFLLGRLMGLADCLHRNYCIIERNKETLKTHTKPIPGQLMGSAVYQTALQRPKEALKMLFGKMQIYINWASANPDSQSGWIIKKISETFKEIEVDGIALPERPTLDEQVELIVGYGSELSFPREPYYKNSADQEKSQEEEA